MQRECQRLGLCVLRWKFWTTRNGLLYTRPPYTSVHICTCHHIHLYTLAIHTCTHPPYKLDAHAYHKDLYTSTIYTCLYPSYKLVHAHYIHLLYTRPPYTSVHICTCQHIPLYTLALHTCTSPAYTPLHTHQPHLYMPTI